MMDFRKVINVEKKKFISQKSYLYVQVTDILKFDEVLLCTYCRGLFRLQKTVVMLIFLCMHKTRPILGNEKEQ